MDLAAVEKAAQVMPVFVRNEHEPVPQVNMTKGCFRCTNHLRPLGTRASYVTLVVYSRNLNNGEYEVPQFGFTISMNDNSYRELSRYHWIRYLITGGVGVYNGWTRYGDIEDEPTIFVRLFNAFDGQGVQHRHARVNVFEYVEHLEQGDLWVSVFEPHHGRPGLYVEPVEELLQGRLWGIDAINEFVHMADTNTANQQRMANYYWNGTQPQRLTQLQAGDTMPEVEPDRNDRMAQINAVVRDAERARLRRVQQRLIEERAGNRRAEVRGVEWNAVAGNNANAIVFDDGVDVENNPF